MTNECYHIIDLENDTETIKHPIPNSFDLMKISHSDDAINVVNHDSQEPPRLNRIYEAHDSN